MTSPNPALVRDVEERRTFAIISHPDAGKTTLTEKLLLFGGAIQMAGAVKGRKASRHATSDWMEVEKQRGISVTSSVMQFHYRDHVINLLDTPGHEDFSEDTYRVLTAVDAAVMVIDAAKGVEAQTIKLLEVCRMRKTPIITFINKFDREVRDPLDLLGEIENVLKLQCVPITWPIGMGKDFLGCYDLFNDRLILMNKTGDKSTINATIETCKGLDDPKLDNLLPAHAVAKLREDVTMVRELCPAFDLELYLAGAMTPVFFGSAINNFGVKEVLEGLHRMGPSPRPQPAAERTVQPQENKVTGFVFKIQANMDPKHRDRIAFMRICSGKFERGMEAYHVQEGKNIKLATGTQLMAQDRAIVDEAYAGDIIGLFDPGIFSIGDTLCTGKKKVEFAGIPTFSPEHFARIEQKDTMKRKQFVKGMEQIAQEGAIQIFREVGGGMEEVVVGVVGVLQLEVLEYRLNTEYNVEIRMQQLPFEQLRWVKNDPDTYNLRDLDLTSDTKAVEDMKGNRLLLFTSDWAVRWAETHNETLELSEFGNI